MGKWWHQLYYHVSWKAEILSMLWWKKIDSIIYVENKSQNHFTQRLKWYSCIQKNFLHRFRWEHSHSRYHLQQVFKRISLITLVMYIGQQCCIFHRKLVVVECFFVWYDRDSFGCMPKIVEWSWCRWQWIMYIFVAAKVKVKQVPCVLYDNVKLRYISEVAKTGFTGMMTH